MKQESLDQRGPNHMPQNIDWLTRWDLESNTIMNHDIYHSGGFHHLVLLM